MKMPKLNAFTPDCPRIRIFNPVIETPLIYAEPQNKIWEEYRESFEKEKDKI